MTEENKNFNQELTQESSTIPESVQEQPPKKLLTKKRITILALILGLIVIFVVVFSACSNSGIRKANNLISSIGTVTLDSEDDIKKAEEAFKALSEEKQAEISDENKEILTSSRETYDELKDVYDAIEGIGEVELTSECEDAISDAESKYNSLSSDEKEFITNYSTLEKAVEKYDELYSAQQVNKVIKLINKIGKVTLNKIDKIEDARDSFDELTEEEQKKVTNKKTLTSAESQLKKIKKQASKAAFAKLTSDYDSVEGITWYYPSTFPEYIDTRSYFLPYIGKNSSGTWFGVRANYTGDDWIFWENMKIVVDGETYNKSFSYFSVERDNDNGLVWEYADITDDDSYIDIFEKIANSSSAVVRFQGDNYYYDLTISSADKAAIKNVITAYKTSKY